jgi:hypothetical protein
MNQTETRTNVEQLLEKLNAAIIDGVPAQIVEARHAFDEGLTKLNDEERGAQMTAWMTEESPVLAALKADGQYVLTCASKDKKADTFSLDVKTEIIDLAKEFDGQAVFADKQWFVYAEALNHAIKDYLLKIGKIVPKKVSERLENFKLSATAKALGIGVDKVKTTKGLTDALQRVVNAIIPGFEVQPEDSEMLRLNYSKWGKAPAAVSLSIESSFRKQLTRVLVAIVNDGYSAE